MVSSCSEPEIRQQLFFEKLGRGNIWFFYIFHHFQINARIINFQNYTSIVVSNDGRRFQEPLEMAAGAPASGRWDVERRLDPAGGPTWANHGSKRRLNQPPDEITVGGGAPIKLQSPLPLLSPLKRLRAGMSALQVKYLLHFFLFV
jgi:hypothetical protein